MSAKKKTESRAWLAFRHKTVSATGTTKETSVDWNGRSENGKRRPVKTTVTVSAVVALIGGGLFATRDETPTNPTTPAYVSQPVSTPLTTTPTY